MYGPTSTLRVCFRPDIHRHIEATRRSETAMPLLNVVVVLIVVGVLLWLINRYIPMQGTIKSILNAVVVIVVVLWLLNIFGLFNSFSHLRVGS
jgi:hypothetical protein